MHSLIRPPAGGRQLSSAVVLLACCGLAGAQGVTNNNEIFGTISFDNVNPAVLAILDSPENEGFRQASISAASTNRSPPLTASSVRAADMLTSTSYTLTVEGGPPGDGIIYEVAVTMLMQENTEHYWFTSQTSSPVFREADLAPPVLLDFTETASILDVRFEDCNGDPAPIQGGRIDVWEENPGSPGTFNVLQARRLGMTPGTTSEDLAVRGDTDLRVRVRFQIGSDPFSSQLTFEHELMINIAADSVEPVVCVVPGAGVGCGGGSGPLGEIVGVIDMLCEDEHALPVYTFVQAFNGPFGNVRYDTVPGVFDVTPSSGPFQLENLVPGFYDVAGQMLFRKNDRYELFITPQLAGGNGRAEVFAGQVTDLMDLFVMNPGFVNGPIFFQGPLLAGGGSCFEGLRKDTDNDFNADGVPDNIGLSTGSYIESTGLGSVAPGATYSTVGGLGRTSFAGGTAGPDYIGDYELVLAGLQLEDSNWSRPRMRLWLENGLSAPDSHLDQRMFVRDALPSSHTIVSDTVTPCEWEIEVPFIYCFSRVRIDFTSTSGKPFFNPRVTGSSGSFVGTDFQGSSVNQLFSGLGAEGTPLTQATAAASGSLVMCLPQGTYDLRPFVTSVNSDSTTSNTELPRVDLTVGCGQDLVGSPDLFVFVDPLPRCTDLEEIVVMGDVQSTDDVVSITYNINGGPEIAVTSTTPALPAEDPTFDFVAELGPCQNVIEVTVMDENSLVSMNTSVVIRDGTPPVFDDCPTEPLVVDGTPAGAPLASVTLPTATDDCGLQLVSCDAPDPLPVGSTAVSCMAIDLCENVSVCDFEIVVVIRDPPEIICPADIIIDNDPGVCGATVDYQVTLVDPQPDVVIACSPPPGSVFPTGTTQVCCVATDPLGQSDDCCFDVTVNDIEPPQIICPDDIVVCNDRGRPKPGCSGGLGRLGTSFEVAVGVQIPAGRVRTAKAQVILNHGRMADLKARLFSPAGTSVDLWSQQCGDASGTWDLIFNDGPDPFPCPGRAELHPEGGSMSMFVGEEGGGTWRLVLVDAFPGEEQAAELIEFCVYIESDSREMPVEILLPGELPGPFPQPIPIPQPGQGLCGARVKDHLQATDNCAVAGVSCTPQLDLFPVGTTPINCTVTDTSGNQASCDFTITVLDCEPPQIRCPVSVATGTDPGRCDASPLLKVTASDNCPGFTVQCTSPLDQPFPVGLTAVCCTATDVGGNQTQCCFDVLVKDTEPPKIICPDDAVFECGGEVPPAVASDNCGVVLLDFADTATGSGCAGTGSLVRTWTAMDAEGNISQCAHEVVTVDTSPPVIDCGAVTLEPFHAPRPSGGSASGSGSGGSGSGGSGSGGSGSGGSGSGGTLQPLVIVPTATDACGGATLQILAVDCFTASSGSGSAASGSSGGASSGGSGSGGSGSGAPSPPCDIEIQGDTVVIYDTGPAGTVLQWTVQATDGCGNTTVEVCEIHVIVPPSGSGSGSGSGSSAGSGSGGSGG